MVARRGPNARLLTVAYGIAPARAGAAANPPNVGYCAAADSASVAVGNSEARRGAHLHAGRRLARMPAKGRVTMPQNIIGTGGNDNLTLTDTSAGVHTVRGLGGDDTIFADANFVQNAVAQIFGEDGQDSIRVEDYNGTVSGGNGAERIFYGGVPNAGGALFGNVGSDTIEASAEALFIVGGDGSSDGNDCLIGSDGRDLIFGNGGSDTIEGRFGPNILIGGFDNDSIHAVDSTDDFVFGNEGNDTIAVSSGDSNDTVFAGQGNDSVFVQSGASLYFLNEGNDTLIFPSGGNTLGITVQGGNDSADGDDFIAGGPGGDVILGNGGRDTINGQNGNNTLVGGFSNDSILGGTNVDIVLGNEGDDSIFVGGAAGDTVFGGQGNDLIFDLTLGAGLFLGNEGNDTIDGKDGADTVTGGAGADRFHYREGSDDGDGAAGGPIEHITDVNFAEDRFDIAVTVGFAGNAGTGNATTLAQAAANAIDQVWRQNNSPASSVAAVFSFLGRSYLAVDTFTNGIFQDGADILIDVTGAVGTVSASNFIPG
jgi:Ca2+-binding RTX toxin-like protein